METFVLGKESAIRAFAREYRTKFREKLPLRLIISFLLSAGALALYAFLIAYVNEGLWEHNDGLFTAGWLLRYIVSLEGSENVYWVYIMRSRAAFLVLPLFFLLLARGFSKISSMGISAFTKSVFWNLSQYIDDLRYGPASTMLLLGAVLGAAIGGLVQNPVFILLLGMIIYLLAAAREKSLLLNVLFVIWHDMLLLFHMRGIRIFYIDLLAALLRGTALGLLIVMMVGLIIPHGYLYFMPTLVLIVLTVLKLLPGLFGKKVPAHMGLFCFCLTVFVFLNLSGIAFAHDGGWIEGGANFWDWLRSDGAMRVLLAALAVAALCYVSLAFSAIPMIGAIKGMADLAAGRDLITGMPLTGFDKGLAIASLCAVGKVLIQVGTMMSAFGNIGDSIGKGLSGALSGDYESGGDTGAGSGDSSSSPGGDWGNNSGIDGVYVDPIPRPDDDEDDEQQ